jgi:hypothetical protein
MGDSLWSALGLTPLSQSLIRWSDESRNGNAASKPAALQSFADFKTTTSNNPLFSENYENARKIPSGFDAVKTLPDQHSFQESDLLTYNSRRH